MLYTEIIAVCSQIHTKNTNTLCGQNIELYIKTQSVPRSKQSISVIQTNQLMLYREIIAVFFWHPYSILQNCHNCDILVYIIFLQNVGTTCQTERCHSAIWKHPAGRHNAVSWAKERQFNGLCWEVLMGWTRWLAAFYVHYRVHKSTPLHSGLHNTTQCFLNALRACKSL